jgi:MoxR-like ATPase
LFDDVAPVAALNTAQLEQELFVSLLAHASEGDKSTLKKASDLRSRAIYDEVLTALVNSSHSDEQILSLASHVTRNQWPGNKALAAAIINSWQKTPDRSSTAKMLHIAALSDDAETYRKAVELALRAWRDGKLRDLPALELNALLAGEFWTLSSATRSSGAGFVLKRSLASARRELERTKSAN